MTYKAFILSGREEVPFGEVNGWFYDRVEEGAMEQGLICQYNEKGVRVHEYSINDGPLVQLVGTMSNDWGSMGDSLFRNMRALGSERDILGFISLYNAQGPYAPLRKVRVILPTEIGTMSGEELEKAFRAGAVVKGENITPTIMSITDLLKNGR